jgi:hypothetical protein
LGLSACQFVPPAPAGDPRVAIRADAGVAMAAEPAVSTTRDGFTRVSVELYGTTHRDVVVTCSADWFEDSGHPVGGLMSMPQRVAIPAAGAGFCEIMSPGTNVHLFRVAVSPSL